MSSCSSSEDHRPITAHGLVSPLVYVAWSSISIHEPSGVLAFHEATSSVASKSTSIIGDVHVEYSYVRVTSVCGSVYSWVPAGQPIRIPPRETGNVQMPSLSPSRHCDGDSNR